MASFTSSDLRLDHFEVYVIRSSPFESQEVRFHGQFDEGPKTAKVYSRELFLAATDKNKEGIFDENAHLTWYGIETAEPEPYRTVVIANQFGDQKYRIGPPGALLVPTHKHPHKPPHELDHFVAYPIVFGEFDSQEVRLRDQFDEQFHTVEVTRPRFFAVPVRKYHSGYESPDLYNPDAHLTFYWTSPHTVHDDRKATDQFGDFKMRIYHSVLLGVPTLKYEWSE